MGISLNPMHLEKKANVGSYHVESPLELLTKLTIGMGEKPTLSSKTVLFDFRKVQRDKVQQNLWK